MNMLKLFAEAKINPGDIGLEGQVTNPNTAITGILDVVYLWAGIICVLIIVIAGYLYVTADANASQIKRAKDAIIGASIGLVVVMMAFGITQFVIGRF